MADLYLKKATGIAGGFFLVLTKNCFVEDLFTFTDLNALTEHFFGKIQTQTLDEISRTVHGGVQISATAD